VLFREAHRELAVKADPAGTRVVASPAAVGQVLDVLLDNALGHGAGRVVVSVAGDGARARLAVEDDGAGVPEEDAEAIFERGSSSVGGGTGIGLHLARVLAVAEGGRLVLARPAPPRFELTLPHRRPSDAAATGAPPSAQP
jgi:signal transduction histidine kinase